MARGATYPRAYRRVRACVFRRMPTRGGAPIMAYPGGHPRAYLDVCVREIRGRVGRISLPRFENGAGTPTRPP